MRKAKVALARKLAVVLHRMLADGTWRTVRPTCKRREAPHVSATHPKGGAAARGRSRKKAHTVNPTPVQSPAGDLYTIKPRLS
jgi:hypothetical protein